MTPDAHRRWLVTGSSRGLGRAYAEVALEAGDVVVATARDPRTLDGLVRAHGPRAVPLRLDVRDRAGVRAAVARAVELTGGIDVLVANAGYGLAGAVEELAEDQLREQLEVNLLGTVWCVQAVLPVMRRQGGGHVFLISSIAGVTGYSGLGAYCATKWAIEGLGEALAAEVAGFGIGVTIVEPGEFRTDWSAGSLVRSQPLPAYDEVLAKRRHGLSGAYADSQPGDPRRAGRALLEVLAADERPLRLLLGGGAADTAPAVHRRRLAEYRRWDGLARTADSAPDRP